MESRTLEKNRQNQSYDDIIDLPHHRSVTHSHMSRHDRAAQFSPFAALIGYEQEIHEAARLTNQRIELDETQKTRIDETLRMIQERISKKQEVSILYFVPDEKKEGGSYVSIQGAIKNLNQYEHCIVMSDGTQIPIDDVIEITGDFLELGGLYE